LDVYPVFDPLNNAVNEMYLVKLAQKTSMGGPKLGDPDYVSLTREHNRNYTSTVV
jgi:hypothetical protein